MNTQQRGFRLRTRHIIGLVVILVGFVSLYGAGFIPIDVILRDRDMIPMPERLAALWVMVIGAGIVLWPKRGAR